MTIGEIEALYLQNDLARRIVDEVVVDSFRPGLPSLQYTDSGEPVKLSIEESHFIIELMKENSTNARLFGGGHVMLVTQGDSLLTRPLDWDNPPKFENAFTLDRYEATPCGWGEDPREPKYMEPVYYQITPSGSGGTTKSYPRVHYSRLLSQRGARVPRKLRRYLSDYDDSVLQQVWNCLRNFYQSEQSIVNVINRFETSTISIAGLSAVQSSEESMALLQERIELMHKTLNILNAALIDADAGEAYERRFATVTGLDTLWDRLATSVAKAARMSKSQLFGEGSSGIRGEDEAGDKGWRKQVEEFRREDLLPNIVKLVSIMKGARVEPILDKSRQPIWGYAESPKPVDEARIGVMEAERVNGLVDRGIITHHEARLMLSGQPVDLSVEIPEPTPEEEESADVVEDE